VEAERLDKRIRLMAQTTRDNFEKVGRLLDDAKRGQVHEILGFKSWTAYVADTVGGQIQLSSDARAAMVQMLAGEGMSVRAIAAATGVSKSTVSNDLNQVPPGQGTGAMPRFRRPDTGTRSPG
jgi:DNA-binding NarL/FixJ family response regulator